MQKKSTLVLKLFYLISELEYIFKDTSFKNKLRKQKLQSSKI